MTDEDDKAPDDAARDGELLLYDFFKHLTSLAILILGGVLVVAQGAGPGEVKPILLILVLVTVGLGGVLAFTGSSEIVRARCTGTPVMPSVKWSRMGSPILLAMGVGMFLYVYVDSLG